MRWESKLVAFGADSASVNLGKKSGLATLLKQEVSCLADFHCLPHRLELALLELQNSCRSVDDVYNVLHLIWKTYNYSPKSVRALKSIADELEINILKPTQVRGTRWLPHVSRAPNVFVGGSKSATQTESGQYSAVLMHMEDLSVNSKNADIQGRARYIADKMKDVHFAAFCHFLADLFAILSRLSLQMQRNDIILPTVVSLLKESLVRIESLPSRPVPDGYLTQFLQATKTNQTFQGVVLRGSLEGKWKRGRTMTDSLQSKIQNAVNLSTKGLKERFDILHAADSTEVERQPTRKEPEYGPREVLRDMLVFNVNAWPTRSSELMEHGRQEVQRLTNWFRVALERAGCNEQWVSLKIQVNSQLRKLDYVTLWQTLLTKVPYKEDFKDILHLVEILLVLPISAAQCERAVSAQNRIKSSTRAMLGVSLLEDLICISSEGPPVADFDPAPAVARWFSRDKSKGERSRQPHFLNN